MKSSQNTKSTHALPCLWQHYTQEQMCEFSLDVHKRVKKTWGLMWHRGLSHHPLSTGSNPNCSTSYPGPDDCLVKSQKMTSIPRALLPTWATQIEFQAPGFGLAQLSLLRPIWGSEAGDKSLTDSAL